MPCEKQFPVPLMRETAHSELQSQATLKENKNDFFVPHCPNTCYRYSIEVPPSAFLVGGVNTLALLIFPFID
jgi:hypothetical protein